MSTAAAPAFVHSAFYRFTPLPDTQATAAALRALGAAQGLNGAIVVATEGLNGAVSGPPAAVEAFEEALRGGALLGGAARGLSSKRSTRARDPVGRVTVVVKPENGPLWLNGRGPQTHALLTHSHLRGT